MSLATVLFFFESIRLPAVDSQASLSRGWWVAAFVVAGATAIGQVATATGDLRVPHRAATFGIAYEYGFTPAEGLSEYGEMRWMSSKASRVIHVDAPWYQMTFWHPRPQSAEPVAVSVALDGRAVLEREIRGPEPVSFFLQVPTGQPSMVLDFAARPAAAAQTLGLASAWRRELPAGVAADRVVR